MTIAREPTRLERLKTLRNQLDVEIERETRFQQRIRRIGVATHSAIKTRDDWSTRVVDASARWYGVSAANILSPSRRHTVATARTVAAFLLRQSGRSFPEIGRILNRDHSTIMYAVKRVETDPNLLAVAQHVERELTGEETAA